MYIRQSIDIADECRKALEGHITAYCRPLPAEYELPNVLISQTSGTQANDVDTFVVTVDARASTEAEADSTMRKAVGILKAVAKEQTTKMRHVGINVSGSWGNDPLRPDIALSTATLTVVAHNEETEV